MHILKTSCLRLIYFLVLVFCVAGCSLEKKNAVNRSLQNLTAHYNILFDANEILRLKQQSYALSFVDSYDEILSVYQDTTQQSGSPDKDLEDAKAKGNKIIAIKEQSHYQGDAYMVLGKANYLEGDYFQAEEFFSYVIRSFPSEPKLTEEALVWKARTLIRIDQLRPAKLVVDSAIQNITKKTKKSIIADAYATKLQYDINVQDYADGEEMAKQAVHYCGTKLQRLRWTFILAQLQELNNKTKDAYKNYTSVINSNVEFEMAFNADLNRIRITENQNGAKAANRIEMLKALTKNANNKDFTDQIYYQIGALNYADKNINEAIKNYRISVRSSRKNPNQKGLSYLRLADIFFRDKADYVSAKKYYDSTLFNLSPAYPGYQIIKRKSDNLQLLADRYGVIAREDTLQMLAKMDETARSAKIDAMVNAEILKRQTLAADDATPIGVSEGGPNTGRSGSSFYFYNANAISQGYNDFRRKWGNRKLEDNWRRSDRANSNMTASASQNIDPDAPADAAKARNASTAGEYRKQLTQNLPLTPELMAQSNMRIYLAYFDIANFYRDILGDKKEAIAAYELLLSRFPEAPDKSAIYYNLYRLYSEENPAKSEEYKNLLLKNYADTPFAQTIIDPEYSKKLNDADADLTTRYNQVYDAFSNRQYKHAIGLIDTMQKQLPGNKWSSQLAYLRAISSGHLEKFDPFRNELVSLAAKYPNDPLIGPLVKQHIAYVDAHKNTLMARQFVLMDKDPNEEPFIPPTVNEPKCRADSIQPNGRQTGSSGKAG